MNNLNKICSSTSTGRIDQRTADAEALIAGRETERASNLDGELREAKNRCDTPQRAIKLQNITLARECQEASREICKRLKPKYDQVVAELAQAIILLGLASDAEQRFRDEMNEAGVDPSAFWPQMAFAAGQLARVESSRIARWLRAAVVFGFLERKAIPEAWLKVWGCYLDAEICENEERVNPTPKPSKTPSHPNAPARGIPQFVLANLRRAPEKRPRLSASGREGGME